MNSQPVRERGNLVLALGIIGSFLIVAALVWAMVRYTQAPPLGEDRVAVRKKALSDLRATEGDELSNYGWLDQGKGIVRLPIAEAMKLALLSGRIPHQPVPISSRVWKERWPSRLRLLRNPASSNRCAHSIPNSRSSICISSGSTRKPGCFNRSSLALLSQPDERSPSIPASFHGVLDCHIDDLLC